MLQKRPLGRTGIDVSILGFGASPLGGIFGEVDSADATRAAHIAVDLGVNLFDVAPYYGITRAETALGKALAGIPRERYLLATKVGRYGDTEFDFSAGRIMRSIEESLQRLGAEVIDIITCHDIEFVSISQVVGEAIPALHRARDQGKVRFIGVSGLPLKIYHTVLDQVPLDTVLSYCHHTLLDSSLLDHLPYLQRHKVGIINASPFAMGLLTERSLPEWHPASDAIRAACRRAADYCRANGTNVARLALQYAIANPAIPTTLVGMRSAQEVEQNIAWIEDPIDPQLLAEVEAILAPVHNRTWDTGLPENR